ncbi:HTH_48 domain-containing protein [Trichonephila clavipes]|nr:HTH_48 domain-containing protein [Trichonephila clavipes]
MEVTCGVEQRAYIKLAVLRGRNVMECHSELVETYGNNALPYRTVARWVGKFQQETCVKPVMSKVRDDSHMVRQMMRLVVFSASHIVGSMW